MLAQWQSSIRNIGEVLRLIRRSCSQALNTIHSSTNLVPATTWVRNWKSPRGGVNRRKLKFTNFKHNYKSGLALEIKSSLKERVKNKSMQMKRMTQWFVLLRFDSCKPTPRWGGHKDRVSFNPFPLSNSHLDRVSFLHNQTGSLRPLQGPPQLGISCFDYKYL
jgi:hypothetical protein